MPPNHARLLEEIRRFKKRYPEPLPDNDPNYKYLENFTLMTNYLHQHGKFPPYALEEEGATRNHTFTQLLTLQDSMVSPTPDNVLLPAAPLPPVPASGMHTKFDPIAIVPIILYAPAYTVDPLLGPLYEVPVFEQMPPLPPPIDLNYQFSIAMDDSPAFVTEPYFWEPPPVELIVEEPELTPAQRFERFQQIQEEELTHAEAQHKFDLRDYFNLWTASSIYA